MNECNIVRDLMPLYADDVASADSAEFITHHTRRCEECRRIWERCNGALPPAPNPEEDPEKYKKGLRKGKWKIFLTSLLAWLLVIAIGAGVIVHQCYQMGWYPVWKSYPSPGGGRIVELVDRETVKWFYHGEGVMVRFRLLDEGGYLNRYETNWADAQVYWADDDLTTFFDIVTVDGVRMMRIVDQSEHHRKGGTHEIPDMTEDLIPVLTGLCEAHPQFPTGWTAVEFTFSAWAADCETVTLAYETDQGQTGRIDYHYPTEKIVDVWTDGG